MSSKTEEQVSFEIEVKKKNVSTYKEHDQLFHCLNLLVEQIPLKEIPYCYNTMNETKKKVCPLLKITTFDLLYDLLNDRYFTYKTEIEKLNETKP